AGNRARKIVGNLLGFLIAILVPLMIFAAIFADRIVPLLLTFRETPLTEILRSYAENAFPATRMELAIMLFRWIVWYLLFISISAVLLGALNASHVFVVPAITPILFSIAVIGAIIFIPIPLMYRYIVGILTGGIAQVFFQLPAFLKKKYRFVPDFRFGNEDFRTIRRQWIPVLISASIFSVNQLVANYFASGLEPGSVSALSNAVVYFQLPMGIFANSVITVMFPQMSRQVTLSDNTGLRETVNYSIRFILILLVPSTILLILLGREVISTSLERGMFTSHGTLMAYQVLMGFALGLFSTGVLTFFQRLFYAMKDYKTPLVAAGIMLAVDVICSLILKETALRVMGLSVANSIAFTAGAIILLVIARRRLGLLGIRKMIVTGVKTLIANIPLALLCVLYIVYVVEPGLLKGFFQRTGGLVVVTAAGFGIAMLLCLVFKVDIVEDIIKRRLGKKEQQ
ncbi:MAG: murein biosynthesis integral membrane protein MurJ, partial [Spirochaetaceae bacterium]